MSDTRYRRDEITLTRAEARSLKAKAIMQDKWERDSLRRELAEAEKNLKITRRSPPPTTCVRRYPVERGEPGYDELPSIFDPINYIGKFEWINQPSTNPPTPHGT